MRRLLFTLLIAGFFVTNVSWANTSRWYNPMTWFSNPGMSTDPFIANQAEALSSKTKNLDPEVLKLGLAAYSKAKEAGLVEKPILTIIDYSKPATEPRLVVIDLSRNEVPFEVHVAHGKNSGGDLATHFSNKPQSLTSSLGVFVTGQTYYGKHGYSLRLNGLERGFNDNAAARAIVIHGSDYVSEYIAKKFGRLGRSWGCPAVSADLAGPIINKIRNGTLIFAYYPDRHWLTRSRFLKA